MKKPLCKTLKLPFCTLLIPVVVILVFIFLNYNRSKPTGNNDTALEVIPIKTSYGISGVSTQPCPSTLNLPLPKNLTDLVDSYCVSDRIIFIGPKDWEGEAGIGADGSLYVHLYSGDKFSESEPNLKIIEIPGCVGCALEEATPYFEEARTLYNKEVPAPTKIPENLEVKNISPGLVSYYFPKPWDNLVTKGIAYFKVTDGQPYLIKMELTTTEEQGELEEFLLDTFVDREKLN